MDCFFLHNRKINKSADIKKSTASGWFDKENIGKLYDIYNIRNVDKGMYQNISDFIYNRYIFFINTCFLFGAHRTTDILFPLSYCAKPVFFFLRLAPTEQSPFSFFCALLRQSKAGFLFFAPCSDRAKPVFFFLRLAPTEQSPFSFFYALLRQSKARFLFLRLAPSEQSPFSFFCALLRQSKARFLFFTPCSDRAKPVFFFLRLAPTEQTGSEKFLFRIFKFKTI
jgi:hypothetical protein